MSHWPAHQSLLRHQSHWSRLPRPGLPSDTKENGQQEQGLGPNTCPRTNLSVPHLPAQPIRIQSSDSGSRRGQGGGTLGFSQGKENRCLGKETALGNRGCSPDHLMGFKAKVQESWSPPPAPGQDVSCHRRRRARPRTVTSMSFPFPIPRVPCPCGISQRP